MKLSAKQRGAIFEKLKNANKMSINPPRIPMPREHIIPPPMPPQMQELPQVPSPSKPSLPIGKAANPKEGRNLNLTGQGRPQRFKRLKNMMGQ